ncbi:MAG: two-component system regulatory protein YycI [Bacillota bacterium]|nr:two-component system regulatory protein YycI [Bacillota bacterium]
MDWSKAKNILIAVLVALNVFLLINNNIYSKESKVSSETVENTIKALEAKGVTVNCEIPRTETNPGRLTYEDYKLDAKEIAQKLLGNIKLPGQPVYNQKITNGDKELTFENSNLFDYTDTNPKSSLNISDKSKVEQYVKSYLGKIGLPVSEFSLDSYERENKDCINLVYYQKYKGYIVFDSYSKVTVTNKGITALKCSYKKPLDITDKSSKKIVSVCQILLKEYMDPGRQNISGINLGFLEYNLENNTREYYDRPVWRITTGDGKYSYFSVDGTKLQ